jgi:cholesterol oxidase
MENVSTDFPGAEVTAVPVESGDGLKLALTRYRRPQGQAVPDVVLLHHGLTAASDMFVMPEHRNLVTELLDAGYEVWTFDSRMSNRLKYNRIRHRYTLDHVARFDHPAAVKAVRAHIGDRPLHAVAHCLGSVSLMMGVAAGWVTGLTSVTSNSVALVQRVPRWSRMKLVAGPDLMEHVLGMPGLDPNAVEGSAFTKGWLLSKAVSTFHRECDVPACHMISFMWGTGWPNLYSHEQLDDRTHQRIGELLGPSGVHYYRHVRVLVAAGHAVRYGRGSGPQNYLEAFLEREDTPPVLFLAGTENHTFLDSNVECFRLIDDDDPGRHELRKLPGYGHIDPFIGKHADRDVFPVILDFLDRHRGSAVAPVEEKSHQEAS